MFEIPTDTIRKSAMDMETDLKTLALSEKSKTLSTAEFLLNRPESMLAVKSLKLADYGRPPRFDMDNFDLATIDPEFYPPIYKAFAGVITASLNLAKMSLHSLQLTVEIIRSISQLRALHALDLLDCVISRELEVILASRKKTETESLALGLSDLRIEVCNPTEGTCQILLLFPYLHNLSLLSSDSGSIVPPHARLWPRFAFFHTLERFSLNVIDCEDIPLLGGWMRSATGGDGLKRLTHFRLATTAGINDGSICNLLATMQAPMLEALFLRGLSEAHFTLFNQIGELFKDSLIALMLVRRASNRQTRNSTTTWPGPSWEYAPFLSRFTKLQHFGWNNQFDRDMPTPTALVKFENNFGDVDAIDCGNNDDDEEDDFGLDAWSALPFASHCPSLRTFASTENSCDVCQISRAPNGVVAVKTLDMMGVNGVFPKDPFEVAKWNLSPFEGWPRIFPEDVLWSNDYDYY